MEITDRIRMIMKMNQLNAAALADRIGVRRSNVSHVLTGRNKPSLDFIEKILVQFPRVNAGWLISGTVQQQDAPNTIAGNEHEAENENTAVSDTGTNVDLSDVTDVTGKKVVKIITFYEDFTFDEFRPNN